MDALREDNILRQLAAETNEDPQERLNYWVRRMAFDNRTSTDVVKNWSIVKQEPLEYTGEFYDYSITKEE